MRLTNYEEVEIKTDSDDLKVKDLGSTVQKQIGKDRWFKTRVCFGFTLEIILAKLE
jgi:hypothetical protein